MMDEMHMLMALRTAVAAGEEILRVYRGDFAVTHKADESPLTAADTRSHQVIVRGLQRLGVPMLSEEGKETPYRQRKHWSTLWIVDPLDGTKEFIKRNGEFTVNIAWVKEGIPEWGVIYVPDKGILYFGGRETGAYRFQGKKEDELSAVFANTSGVSAFVDRCVTLNPTQERLERYTVVGSRSHPSEALEAFLADQRVRYGDLDFVSAGSSLKFCMLAEGRAHIYPRLGPTMEWDTAAGHAVAEGAGCTVSNYDGGGPLQYNKKDLLNPWFVVYSPMKPPVSEAGV